MNLTPDYKIIHIVILILVLLKFILEVTDKMEFDKLC